MKRILGDVTSGGSRRYRSAVDAKRLRGVVACPSCRSRLDWLETELRCPACEARYPLRGGVPILTVGDAPAPPPARSAMRRALRPVLARKFATARMPQRFVASFPAGALVLNGGAGTEDYGPTVVNLDLEAHPSVDVVASAERLPFGDSCFDGCVLQAVLEHVDDAEEALAEVHRVLVPGGRVLVDVPFIQPYHPTPRDHRRFTEEGLRAALERHGFEPLAGGVAVGPGSAMAAISAEFLALLLSGRSRTAYRIARLATSWLAFPLRYTDAWLEGHPAARVVASGVWVHARKA